MMYTFQSKAARDVTMTQANGEQLLQIIGKTPAARGIIEVAALDAAIQALESAAALEQANPDPAERQGPTEPRDAPAEDEVVELHQRVWPMVEMLKRARDEREVIVWGV